MLQSELSPSVDLSTISTKGKYLRKVKLNESKLFEILNIEPEKVRVEVFDEKILRD